MAKVTGGGKRGISFMGGSRSSVSCMQNATISTGVVRLGGMGSMCACRTHGGQQPRLR